MKNTSADAANARFDRAAFEGMALDWTAFGRVSPDEAARERVALDSAAREAARRAAAGLSRAGAAGVTDAAAVARRTGVRGGIVCGRRAPVLRIAAIRTDPRTAADTGAVGRRHAQDRRASERRRLSRRLRLTARGRFVLIVLPVAALLSGALIGLAGQQQATASTTQAPALTTVIVPTGGSLWSVARLVAPSADPRDVVAEFARVNDLTGTEVQAGERLAVPAEYSG